MNVFELMATISLDTSGYEKGVKNASKQAEQLGGSLDDLGDSASEAGEDIEDSGKDAEKAGNGGYTVFKNVLANLTTKVITGVVDKVKQLAGVMVDFTEDAVSNYADYEQLVGGVETLFGNSASTLQKYADNAYKTVQLSANDYMETATSFAASLIQGLGGDTEAAVELSNLAITDMADNANKMGTDMESIQNAYQGFAKQNYTMLDNLKLGYGGTQSEMIRLINDSGILNEEISSLDGITFDQMIEAIHAVQDQLGITETSAEEAGSTISGSWASIQAMFENIKTKVGSELAPIVMNFLSQLSEWLDSVDWDEVASQVGNALESVEEWLGNIDFESVFQKGLEILQQVIPLAGQIITKLTSMAQWVTEHKQLLQVLLPIITSIITVFAGFKVLNTVKTLITGVKGAFTALSAAFSANPIGAVITIIALLVTTLITLWNTNENFRNAVINLWNTIQDVFGKVAETFGNIKDTIVNALGEAKENASETLNNMKSAFEEHGGGIEGIAAAAMEGVKGFFKTGYDTLNTLTNGKLGEIANKFTSKLSNVKETVKSKLGDVKSAFSDKLGGAYDTVSTKMENIRKKFSDKMESAKTTVSNAIEKIKGFFNFTWSLPKIKMPHFSISGSFSLNPPSTPKFSVSWYKKAMSGGMILDDATIFGYSSTSGNLLGGGEAGSEVVAGTSALMNMIQTAVDSSGTQGEIAQKIDALLSMMQTYFPQFANMQMVTDTGALVGSIAAPMDRALGKIYTKKQRGQ